MYCPGHRIGRRGRYNSRREGTAKACCTPGSAFVGATGDAARNTAIGRQYLIDILHDPLSTVTSATHKVFGNVIRVRRTDGSSVWFRENGG